MKTIAPHYYKNFICSADKCQHTCCAGWEIDIDEFTHSIYKNHTGTLKSRFEKFISTDGDSPHFILDEKERCPFLNESNLCDIYIEMGEENLCNICTEHPRFRNYFSDRCEMGIGLCCEETASLILKNTEKFHTFEVENDDFDDECTEEETVFFALRQKIFDILENRETTFDERCKKLFDFLEISDFSVDFRHLFNGLEYMEHNICDLTDNSNEIKIDDIYLENLAVYFIYRHLSDAIDDNRFKERILFSIISAYAIEKMCKTNDFAEICECARIYSSEIEYSEENTEEILKQGL